MLALALPIMAYGVIYHTLLIVVGAALLIGSVFGWALEPSTAPESDFDPPSDGGETEQGARGPCLTPRITEPGVTEPDRTTAQRSTKRPTGPPSSTR